jgi:hypothetical protein
MVNLPCHNDEGNECSINKRTSMYMSALVLRFKIEINALHRVFDGSKSKSGLAQSLLRFKIKRTFMQFEY